MYNMKFRNDFKMLLEKLKEICDDLDVAKVKASITKSREI